MPTYEVDVQGTTYEVDAPNENTAWAWAYQTHQGRKSAPPSTDRTWGEAAKDIGAGVRAESAAQINQEAAKGDAAMATAIGVLVVGAFLWLTLKRIWHKSRATPHQNGIFIGSTLAALAIGKATGQITTALLFQPVHSGEAIGMASVLGTVGAGTFFAMGYASGWIFRRLKPLPSTSGETPFQSNLSEATPVKSPARPSDAMYAQAMAELEAKSSTMDRGLWARCYAEADGVEATTKAQYLRERVKQLAVQGPDGASK